MRLGLFIAFHLESSLLVSIVVLSHERIEVPGFPKPLGSFSSVDVVVERSLFFVAIDIAVTDQVELSERLG